MRMMTMEMTDVTMTTMMITTTIKTQWHDSDSDNGHANDYIDNDDDENMMTMAMKK